MKKSKKIIIIISLSLIAIGLVTSFIGLVSMNFDITKINDVTYSDETYSVNEDFSNVYISSIGGEIKLLRSDDALCKVLVNENSKISCSVRTEDDTLHIDLRDNRKWYEHISFFGFNNDIAVYFPQEAYDALHIETASSDIEVSQELSFASAEISTMSGEVDVKASISDNISINTTSGDISVENSFATEVTLKSVSGEINGEKINCKSISAKTTSGEIELKNVVAEYQMNGKSVSGSIFLDNCDADYLKLSTTSGDVRGQLLTSKTFVTDTTSGDVNVPRSIGNGTCEIKTTSGDIYFANN